MPNLKKIPPLLVFVLLANSFSAVSHAQAQAAELAKEYPPADEAQAIERLVELILEAQEDRLRQNGRPARRGQHAKHHGCVRAEFQVAPELPERARHGVFAIPGKTYPAWLRFSNGSGEIQPDRSKDAHGFAVKLMGVEGEKLHEDEGKAQTQDFILLDHPVFFIRSVKEYVALFEELAKGSAKPYFIPGLNPFKWKWSELRAARASVSKRIRNPLAATYYSTVPSLLGPGAVKYSVRPCAPQAKAPKVKTDDGLRHALVESLAARPACFDFLAQWQTDAVKMPIEDSTVRWDEKLSAFIPVARIHIPAQNFDTPARREHCENLYFTPWHALPEHRPLGGIQRARLEVYKVMSKFRRMKNGAAPREPEAGDPVPD